jgi:anti-sigma factor RsiW
MAKRGHQDIELMQHADGELDERGAAGVRALIEKDPDARTKVESLGQMNELVRGHLELSADEIPDRRFEAMWREVRKSIDVEAPVGVWARISAWFEKHRGHVITGAVSAGAVAALALVLRPGSPDPVQVQGGRLIDVEPAALRAPPVIEDLETPGGNSTVLNIEDEDGHMTMILVTPADTVEGI